ncbi:MAG: metal ABC transporter permease, partial [Alphaproteobacteria bacterium]|nr:metal ABC transporter permease [Alphaproteobacteria bacterium]
ILAHGALALGLVVLALMEDVRFALMAYLFGDILAVSMTDLVWVCGGGVVILAALAAIWRPLLAITVHRDLAFVEGVSVNRTKIAFVLLLALAVALAMKVVGILLVTSLIIIPAAVARRFARNPEQMAVLAIVAGWVSVAAGIWASFSVDAPTGPSIVVAACILFAVSGVFKLLR